MFSIYKITSPSGRCYVGVTKQPVKTRWQQHVRHARTNHRKHPFRSAIRKYGEDAFTVETIGQTHSEAEAIGMEKQAIISTGALLFGYNVSEGGEYDWRTGVDRLRALREDPVFDKQYRKALSAGVRASVRSSAWLEFGLPVAQEKWREDNPRDAWRIAYRASRIAARKAGVPPAVKKDPRFSKCGRLYIPGKRVAEARRNYKRPERTARMWARRTAEERAAVASAIAKAATANHAAKTDEERAAHSAQLAEARKNIDHSKRKANQKIALKAYWTPERREAKRQVMRAFAAKKRAEAKCE